MQNYGAVVNTMEKIRGDTAFLKIHGSAMTMIEKVHVNFVCLLNLAEWLQHVHFNLLGVKSVQFCQNKDHHQWVSMVLED